ncbi:MAG TPA: hypothetical protein VMX12_01850 [Acidimicrobiia bacterium]|nr:hypothetical protein [Acidimicrobiia bacterium]
MARLDLPPSTGDKEQPEIARVWALRPELGKPVAALSAAVYQQSQIPARVRESVRMRIAQINDCPI